MEKINLSTTKYESVLFWATHNSILATLCQFYHKVEQLRKQIGTKLVFFYEHKKKAIWIKDRKICFAWGILHTSQLKLNSMFHSALKGRLRKVEVCGSNITFKVCILSIGVFAVRQSLWIERHLHRILLTL